MAHKAKPKRKPNPETSSSVTKKSNQKTAPKQQTKTKPDAEATKNDNKEPTSYSFTQVVRVRNNSSIEASAPFKKRYLPSLDTDSKSSVLLYHKREKRTQGIDIIGVQLLNTWKKSAGRSKSWRSCRRLKITPGDLEFLIESKNSPVSFGWPFSSSITPSTFSRSRDLRINQSLGRRSNRSSNIPVSRDLVEDYGRHWPLPRGRPYKRSIPLSENIEFRGGISYLRLQLDHGTVSMTQGEFLSIIDLPKPQTLPRSSSRKQHPSKSLPEQLIVIDLLRNESHADVYVVRSPNIPTQIYHAHAFLNNNLSGNWSTFSRRKMERLRKSIGFRGETVQDGMKILIMEDISKFNEVYHVKNKQQEFPLLPQTGEDLC